MNRSIFWMIKYMNGSIFSKARYMNGVGFEILACTPLPNLPPRSAHYMEDITEVLGFLYGDKIYGTISYILSAYSTFLNDFCEMID